MDSIELMPLPPRVKVLKAPHELPSLGEDCALPFDLGILSSPKLDGDRGLCVRGNLYTSSMQSPTSEAVYRLLQPLASYAHTHDLVFDYELYDPQQTHHGATSGLIRALDETLPSTFGCYVFDAMPYDDFLNQCVELEYGTRVRIYEDAVRDLGHPRVHALPQRPCTNAAQAHDLFQQDLAAGYEGSMLRTRLIEGDPDSVRGLRGGFYKHGRATVRQAAIFKLKLFETCDGIILEVAERREQSGEPTGVVGAFKIEYRDHETQERCVSHVAFAKGYGLLEREILWNQHLEGKLVGSWCEFLHMPHGSAGGLRLGRFKRLRPDLEGTRL